jgi:Family of unknown function (DUF6263)
MPHAPHVTLPNLMNRFTRVILSMTALVLFTQTLLAADAIDLKQRWIVGKKYDRTMESTHSSTLTIAGQTIETSVATTMEVSEAVRAQQDGKSKRITMKYERVAMDMSMGGQKISFDSSKPDQGNDPLGLAKTMGSVAGKELQVLLSENDEITGIENYDEFVKQLGASPVPGMDMSKMFSKEAVTQMMKGGGLQAMPGHPVKPGDSWPFSTTIDLQQIGKISLKGTYTLKGVADHDGVQCAEIAADAAISMDMTGADAARPAAPALAALGMKVEGGSMKGTLWFDPKLGFVRESEMTESLTMTMKNPTDPSESLTVPNKQNTHTKLTKVEDLK